MTLIIYEKMENVEQKLFLSQLELPVLTHYSIYPIANYTERKVHLYLTIYI